jgi:hypothetical protein
MFDPNGPSSSAARLTHSTTELQRTYSHLHTFTHIWLKKVTFYVFTFTYMWLKKLLYMYSHLYTYVCISDILNNKLVRQLLV